MSEAKSLQAGLTRRNFLKSTAAVAGLAGMSGFALTGCSQNEGDGSAPEEKKVYTRCMWSGCTICARYVTVRNGVAVKAEPVPDDMHGHRPCLKGYGQLQRMYHPNRVKFPMKRVGERGANQWERISWEQAISEITTKWNEIRAQYGNQAVALYPGTSNVGLINGYGVGFGKRLANIAGFTIFDLCVDLAACMGVARVCGGSGFDLPGNANQFDHANAKSLVIMASNDSEAYPQEWREVIDAKERGVKIVVIDPNQNTIAAKADLWVPLRPASDTALNMGIMRKIVENNLQNTEFLEKYTVAPYLVKASDGLFLRGSDFGIEPVQSGINPSNGQPIIEDPVYVMDESGEAVPESEATKPLLNGTFTINGIKVTTAFDLFCERLNEYTDEKVYELTDVEPSVVKELAKIMSDGPVTFRLGMGSQAYNNGHMVGVSLGCLLGLTGNMSMLGAGIKNRYYGTPIDYTHIMPDWIMGPTLPWLEVENILNTGKSPLTGQDHAIKSIFAAGAILGGGIDGNWVKSVFDRMELVVVADTSLTDTGRYADYVLPCAHYYEFEDVPSASQRLTVLYSGKVADPPFECKPDGDIIRLLADGLGLGNYFNLSNDEYLNRALSSPTLKAAGITLERLREEKEIPYSTNYVHCPDHNYTTPTGKIELYCEKPTARYAMGQQWSVEDERLPRFYKPTEAWPDLEIRKKYPLILTSERSRYRWHTNGFELSWLLEVHPEPTLKINPVDAEARGIKEGEYVEVYNDRGNAVARAVLNPGIRPGMLLYPKGWHYHQYQAGSFSDLSSHVYDPVAINSSFMDAAVELRVWNGGEK